MGATPTSEITYAFKVQGQRRALHNRNLTSHNVNPGINTLGSPVLFDGDGVPAKQLYVSYNGNDIRPGSIYSSHRHALRKFQNQKNIQANRNLLMMQA